MNLRCTNTISTRGRNKQIIVTKGKSYRVSYLCGDIFIFIGDNNRSYQWDLKIDCEGYDYTDMFNLEDIVLLKLKGDFNET